MSMRVSLFELETNLQIFNRFNEPKYVMLPEANPTPNFLCCRNYEVEATLVTRGSNSDNWYYVGSYIVEKLVNFLTFLSAFDTFAAA